MRRDVSAGGCTGIEKSEGEGECRTIEDVVAPSL